MKTFDYAILENVDNEEWKIVASKGGFSTFEDAKAAGELEAARIALTHKKTLSVDVRAEKPESTAN